MFKIQGWVEQGNTKISTGGLTSSNVAQGSFPSSLVTVYIHGSGGVLAGLFSDDNSTPTPLANPFTSNADGTFGFYAISGRYDLVFSGGNLPAPYTISDVTNGAGGGSGDVTGPSSSVDGDIAQFRGTSGKIIVDSGLSSATFVRQNGSHTAAHIAVYDSGAGNVIRDGGTGISSLVSGPAVVGNGNLAVFDGTIGNRIKDGGTPGAGGLVQYSESNRTAGDISVNSTSFADLTSFNAITITTGAHRCLINVICVANNSANSTFFTLVIDGVNQGGTNGLSRVYNSLINSGSFTFMTPVLSAGSHTFKLQARVDGGTQTVQASSAQPLILGVTETNLTT